MDIPEPRILSQNLESPLFPAAASRKPRMESPPTLAESAGRSGGQGWATGRGPVMLLLGVFASGTSPRFLGTPPAFRQTNVLRRLNRFESPSSPGGGIAPAPPPDAETSPEPMGQENAPVGEPLFPVPDGGLDAQAAFEQARTAVDQRRFGKPSMAEPDSADQRPEGYTALQEQAQGRGIDAGCAGRAPAVT